MLGSKYTAQYHEEGRKARREGKNSWDNPYNYVWEAQAAYAWDEGFKEKEAA